MFASVALAATAQILPIVVPLGNPKQIEQPRAPIEIAGPEWALACEGSSDYARPAPPVRIFGNTYLVGTCGISSILITDPAGDILIDGGTEADADLIAANIRKLGFRVTDVKYLLNSHEHFDHAGGLAKLQRLTGAQIVASPAQARALTTGMPTQQDPQAALKGIFPPVRVDRIVNEDEQVRIGNAVLLPLMTPGHTPGAISWHWGSCQGGVCRQVVYADSLTPVSAPAYRFSDHPEYVTLYRSSIAKLATVPCDILLTPHPSASRMPQRLALGKPLDDPDSCRAYASSLTKQLDDRLAKEAAGQ